jgi:hypothetical protein
MADKHNKELTPQWESSWGKIKGSDGVSHGFTGSQGNQPRSTYQSPVYPVYIHVKIHHAEDGGRRGQWGSDNLPHVAWLPTVSKPPQAFTQARKHSGDQSWPWELCWFDPRMCQVAYVLYCWLWISWNSCSFVLLLLSYILILSWDSGICWWIQFYLLSYILIMCWGSGICNDEFKFTTLSYVKTMTMMIKCSNTYICC